VGHAVRVGVDRPVSQQVGRQLVERLGGVDAPDDLAQARALLDGRRQVLIVGAPQLDDLAGLGREERTGAVAADRRQPEVLEEPGALVEVGDAVHDSFHTHDRHGQRSPQLLKGLARWKHRWV